MNFALSRLDASAVAVAGNVGPLTTIALGVVLLDESFGPLDMLGAALVLIGVTLFLRIR